MVDEFHVVRHGLQLLADRTLVPPFADYPPLSLYVAAAADAVLYAGGRVLGSWDSVADFQAVYVAAPGRLYLPVRLVSAACGAAAVWAAWRAGREAAPPGSGTAVGLVAAALLAVAPTAVERGHWAHPDGMLLLPCALVVWMAVRHGRTGGLRPALAAWIAVGAATALKWNAAAVAAAPALAQVLVLARSRPRGLRDRRLWAWLAAPAALAVLAPAVWLDPGAYVEGWAAVRDQVLLGHHDAGGPRWVWPAQGLLRDDPGVGAALLLGLAWAAAAPVESLVRARGGAAARPVPVGLLPWVPAVVGVGLWLAVGGVRLAKTTYLLPAFPALAVCGGLLIAALAARVAGVARVAAPSASASGAAPSRSAGRARLPAWAAAVALAAAAVGPGAAATVAHDRALAREDTRLAALRWIEHEIPAGTTLALGWPTLAPPILSDGGEYRWPDLRSRPPEVTAAVHQRLGDRPRYRVVFLAAGPAAERGSDDFAERVMGTGWRTPAELRALGVEYAVLTDARWRRYVDRPPPPPGDPARDSFLAARAAFRALLALPEAARFAPDDDHSGPVITVHRLR